MREVYFQLRQLEEKILGTPDVSVHLRKDKLYLEVQWNSPLLVYQYVFSILDILRMPNDETIRYMEIIIESINQKYRKAVEGEINTLKKSLK